MSLPELQDGAQSKQKAEYVSHTLSKRGKSDYIELTYKRLDGPNPGAESKTGNFVTALDEASRELIKAKGEFVVVKTKDGKFWPLTGVLSMDKYVAKPVSTFQKGTYSGGSKSSSGSYDTTGVKVGAARNQAIAFLSATKGPKFTLDDVDIVAYDIVTRQAKQEENVRAGISSPQTKPEEIVEQEDTLDNIDF
jgi:hypothetical protein